MIILKISMAILHPNYFINLPTLYNNHFNIIKKNFYVNWNVMNATFSVMNAM
jgi:hypothetical protein